ncbi:MAG TPA: DUF1697 domain-containing protein [Opitutaceae bacterium]|nr:DUF1697 domain-containing protein [Opitutaceae bacterium]
MPRYIAFLRGINLGKRRPKMDELRAIFEKMKFGRVATFIASGNVIFESSSRDAALLGKTIERGLHVALGYEVDTFVRTREEIAAVAAFRPFSETDMEAPESTVYCSFLREPLGAAQARGLLACRTETDEFCVEGREFYWLCRIKSNESKVWASLPVRALKLPSSTMRNLTTIRKLAAQYPATAS